MNKQTTDVKSKDDILRAFSAAMSDPVRLIIAGRLAIQPHSIEELCETLQLPGETVRQHLDYLSQIGLTCVTNDRYRLNDTALAAWVTMVHSGSEKDKFVLDDESGDAFERKTLRDFLQPDGTIKAFPAQEKKFLVIVRYALTVFEPGVRYPEKEVNQLLRRFHPDTAMLRRAMIDYRFMARQGGVYWRIDE